MINGISGFNVQPGKHVYSILNVTLLTQCIYTNVKMFDTRNLYMYVYTTISVWNENGTWTPLFNWKYDLKMIVSRMTLKRRSRRSIHCGWFWVTWNLFRCSPCDNIIYLHDCQKQWSQMTNWTYRLNRSIVLIVFCVVVFFSK